MESRNRLPIGIELVRRGLISEDDVNKALEYQKRNPGVKLRRCNKNIKFM